MIGWREEQFPSYIRDMYSTRKIHCHLLGSRALGGFWMQKPWKTFCLSLQILMHYLSDCPGDKALNAFKWLVLEPGNPLHCQCFHFNQRFPALLHSPGHTALSCLQLRSTHGLSLKASSPHFPALRKGKRAFNGNIEKALQHSVLWNSISHITICHYALKHSALKLLSQALFSSTPECLTKASV